MKVLLLTPLLLLLLSCQKNPLGSPDISSPPPPFRPTSFIDDDSTTFGAGTLTRTQWNTSSLELSPAGMSAGNGEMTSRAFDDNGDATWSNFTWTTEFPTYKNLPNNSQIETTYISYNADMSSNVLLYHMDESVWNGTPAEVVDSSGKGNSGTAATGATPVANGKLGRAGQFTSGLITAPDSPSLNITAKISVEAWVYPTSFPSWGTVVMQSTSSSWNDGYGLAHYTNPNSIYFFVRNYSLYNAGATIPTGQWSHLVGTYDSAYIKLYVNGSLASSTAYAGTINHSATPLRIGNGSGNFPWSGVIDEVAIYNNALSASEVYSHYLRGAVRLKFQARSCATNPCTTEPWQGPDGTNLTYFSEMINSALSFPSFPLTSISRNRYFQYKAFFETDSNSLTPQLSSVSVNATP